MESLPTVIVFTKDEQTIKGALLTKDGEKLILKAAQMMQNLDAQMAWVPLDGDIVIPMENVSFWQQGLDAAILSDTGRVK